MDQMRYPAFRRFSVEDIAKLIESDQKERFELSSLPDYIEGRIRDVWWIRARDMHSIPVGIAICFYPRNILRKSTGSITGH